MELENGRLNWHNTALQQRVLELENREGRGAENTSSEEEMEMEEAAGAAAHRGTFKDWENLTNKWRKKLTEDIKQEVGTLATQRNTTPQTIVSDVFDPPSCPIVIASWFATRGRDGGIGKRIWTQSKAVFHQNRICTFPPFRSLTAYWKREIVPEIILTRSLENNDVNGARFHIGVFMEKHMKRWLESQCLKGRPVVPGYYITHWKAGMDSGRHAWYRWRNCENPTGKKTTQSIGIVDATLLSGNARLLQCSI